jgi:hypothetical protein
MSNKTGIGIPRSQSKMYPVAPFSRDSSVLFISFNRIHWLIRSPPPNWACPRRMNGLLVAVFLTNQINQKNHHEYIDYKRDSFGHRRSFI